MSAPDPRRADRVRGGHPHADHVHAHVGPGHVHPLDAPEREERLPVARLVELLELTGNERVVDYGAGTGRVALAVAEALSGGGEVLAVEQNEDLYDRIIARVAGTSNLVPLLVPDNHVPLDDGSAQRVLAVDLLHELCGERALHEIRRLLCPRGFLLLVDWERGRPGDGGPPEELLQTAAEAAAELRAAGFRPEALDAGLPRHFAIRARVE